MIMPSEEGLQFNAQKVEELEKLLTDVTEVLSERIAVVARESVNVFGIILEERSIMEDRVRSMQHNIRSLNMWLVILLIANVAMAVYMLSN